MNINCIICSDILTPNAEIYTTPCGHLFHYLCLIQWIERSRTCPQCRNKTTENTIHRVYLNLTNTENVAKDVGTLQNAYDNLQFKINLKHKDVKTYREKYENVKAKNVAMRANVKDLENKIRSSDSAIHALKEEISYFKEKGKECNRLIEEVVRLNVKLKEIENVQVVLKGSQEDIKTLVHNNRDPHTLSLLVSVLKKELIEADRKNKQVSQDLKHAERNVAYRQKEITAVQQENDKLKNEIEIHKTCATERQRLKRKISSLEITNLLNESSQPKIRRILSESPTPTPKKPLDSRVVYLDETKSSPSVNERVQQIKNSDSPYLQIKSSNVGLSSLLKSNYRTVMAPPSQKESKTLDLLKYSQKIDVRLPDKDYSYNGLGGHSKQEDFPSPRPPNVLKKPKSSTNRSVKFNKHPANKKLHDFFSRKLDN